MCNGRSRTSDHFDHFEFCGERVRSYILFDLRQHSVTQPVRLDQLFHETKLIERGLQELDTRGFGRHLRVRCENRDRVGAREDAGTGLLVAPMPGRVIAVLVDRDASVEKGQALMVIEAMKMEHTIHAPVAGTVTAVSFGEGDLVEEGVELLAIAPAGGN